MPRVPHSPPRWLIRLALLAPFTALAVTPPGTVQVDPAAQGPLIAHWGYDIKQVSKIAGLTPNHARNVFVKDNMNALRVSVWGNINQPAHPGPGQIDVGYYVYDGTAGSLKMYTAMKNARDVRPDVFLFASKKLDTQNSFPAWTKDANGVIPGEYARMLADFLRFWEHDTTRKAESFTFPLLGIDNEIEYNEGDITPADHLAIVDALRVLSTQTGTVDLVDTTHATHPVVTVPAAFTMPMIIGPEGFGPSWTFVEDLLALPGGPASLDLIGTHYYPQWRPYNKLADMIADGNGLTAWNTEVHWDNLSGQDDIGDSALALLAIFDNMDLGMTGFSWWAYSRGGIKGGLKENITRRTIGARMVASDDEDGTFSPDAQSLLATRSFLQGSTLHIFAINDNDTDRPNLQFDLLSGTIASEVVRERWGESGGSTYYVKDRATVLDSDSFSDSVPPHSINIYSLTYRPPEAVAVYLLDGDAQDAGPNGLHGTASGGTSYLSGRRDEAALLDGGSGKITAPLSISNDFSIAFWMRADATGPAGTHWEAGSGLVDASVAGAADDFGVSWLGSQIALGVGNPDTTLLSQSSLPSGVWQHVTATRRANTGELQIWINGNLDIEGSGPTGPRAAAANLVLGALQQGGNHFAGQLDDVRIYDRVIQTCEIRDLVYFDAPPILTETWEAATPGPLVGTFGTVAADNDWTYNARNRTDWGIFFEGSPLNSQALSQEIVGNNNSSTDADSQLLDPIDPGQVDWVTLSARFVLNGTTTTGTDESRVFVTDAGRSNGYAILCRSRTDTKPPIMFRVIAGGSDENLWIAEPGTQQVGILYDVTAHFKRLNHQQTRVCYSITTNGTPWQEGDVLIPRAPQAGAMLTKVQASQQQAALSWIDDINIGVLPPLAPHFTVCPTNMSLGCDTNLPPTNAVVDGVTGPGPITVSLMQATQVSNCQVTVTRTYTASNQYGISVCQHDLVYWLDDAPPDISACSLPSGDVDCNPASIPAAGDLMECATDTCAIVRYTIVTNGPVSAGCAWSIAYVHTVMDGCGNSRSVTQSFTWTQDASPPTVLLGSNAVVECGQALPPIELSVTDNCQIASNWIEVTTNATQSPCFVSVRRIAWAVDACSNITGRTQEIAVVDTTAPTFAVPPDLTVDCAASTLPTDTGLPMNSFDNCSSISTSRTDNVATVACGVVIARVWILSDDCGNANAATQTITVVDSTPPTFTAPGDVSLDCADPTDPAQTGFPTDAADDCSSVVITSRTDNVVTGSCGVVIARVWTLSDDCGNANAATQTITVVDSTPPTFTAPGDVSLDCADPTDPAQTGFPTDAADDCSSTVITSRTDNVVTGSCGVVIARVWTLSDDCGNASAATQTITVVDSTPPTFTAPGDVNLDCTESTDPTQTGFPTDAADDCSSVVITSRTDNVVSGSCGVVIARVWTLSDDCGNASAATQTITVVDSTPPTFTPPGDVSLDCADPTDPAQTGFPTDAADDCSSVVITSRTDNVVSGSCGVVIARVWTLSDDCGNTSAATQTITVVDSTPPTFTAPGDVSLDCADSTNPAQTGFPTDAADDCSSVVITSRTDNVVTGSCGVVIARVWTLSDDCGNASAATQTITVVDSTPPTFTAPGDVSLDCADSTDPAQTGFPTDADDDCSSVVITSRTDNVVTGSCGVVIARVWSLSDDCGNTSAATQTITVVDMWPPAFDAPPDRTIREGDSTDPSETGAASNFVDNCGSVASDYLDAFVPSGGGAGTLTRTWRAWDACGNTNLQEQVITILSTNGPYFDLPPHQVLECGASTNVADTGVISNSTGNCQLAETNVVDTLIPGGCPGAIRIERRWIVWDVCGNTNAAVQVISLADTTPPSFAAPSNPTIECGDPIPLLPPTNLSDNCGSVSTGFVDAVTAGCTTRVVRVWTLSDDCGNASTATQTITVVDNTPPTFTAPGDVILDCADSTNPAQTGFPTDAADDCSSVVITSRTDNVVTGNCGVVIARVWTLSDGCGNTSAATQTITVVDSTPPTFTAPGDVNLDCTDSTDPAQTGFPTDADEDCSSVVITSRTDNVVSGSCGVVIARVWTLSDDCGNASAATQTITVVDSTPPTFTAPGNVNLDCTDSTDPAQTGFPTDAADDCSSVVTTSRTDNVVTGICGVVIARVWTLSDDCGNASAATQTITVADMSPPTFDAPPDRTIREGDSTDPAETGAASNFVDNCGSVASDYLDAFVPSGGGAGTLTRAWRAWDACGNTNLQEQVITILSTNGPYFDLPPHQVLECGASTSVADTGVISNSTGNCQLAGTNVVDTLIPGACPGAIRIERRWIVWDVCGNTNAAVQVISLADTTPPSFTAPGNPTIECGDPIPLLPPTSLSDNCGSVSTGFVDAVTAGCTACVARVWTLADDCGNAVTHTQFITLIDTTPPTFAVPADTTVIQGESPLPGNTGVPTNIVESCGTTTTTFVDAILTNAFGVVEITRSWRVVDEAGHADTQIQRIQVLPLPPDLRVQAAARPPVPTNSNVLVSATVSNVGPGTAYAVAITNILPAGLVGATLLQPASGCSLIGREVQCQLPQIPPGTSATIQVLLTLDGSHAHSLTNSTRAHSAAPDANPVDNQFQLVLIQPDHDGDHHPDWFDQDDDNDGIPDAWERLHQLDPFDPGDAVLDGDQDGFTHAEEYQSDTDPRVPAEYLRLTRERILADGRELHFPAKATRLYTIQTTLDLINGPWTDLPGFVDIPGRNGIMQAVHDSTDSARHYRVRARVP